MRGEVSAYIVSWVIERSTIAEAPYSSLFSRENTIRQIVVQLVTSETKKMFAPSAFLLYLYSSTNKFQSLLWYSTALVDILSSRSPSTEECNQSVETTNL